MWVRSQGGEMLADTISFEIIPSNQGWCVYARSVTDRLFTIGEFATKEDALAALNEIERCIERRGVIGVYHVPKF